MKIPIRTRLTAMYCTVFCLSTLLLEFGAYSGLTSSINAVVDSELLARMGGVENFLDEHITRKTLPELQSEINTHAALEPEFLSIGGSGGAGEVFRGRHMFAPGTTRVPRPVNSFYTLDSGALPMRVLSGQRTIHNRRLNIWVGVDLSVASEMLRSFRLLAVLSSPVVFAGAFMAGFWISKRALLPVSRLTKAAQMITAANLNQRLLVPNSLDEVEDLAETLNGMLSRIEDAFRHVTQFTANASHELRTPLAIIRTTAEVALLREHGDSDRYREALHRILREAEKNSVLLDDLLRLARADASAGKLTLQPLEFAPQIEEVCERVLPLAIDKNILLEYRAGESGLRVLADPEHLKRLWLILLDNALKYTPSGGSILVSWKSVAPDALICEVRDTGIGISKSDKSRIFERFFRADKARSREEGGAGLGLALASWIVNAHHASIEVESTPGKGSTFRVRMPVLTLSQEQHDEFLPSPLRPAVQSRAEASASV